MKWYTFDQNNSGGYFVTNENVCEVVCIEAETAEQAILKAEEFCENDDSCPCCGDRWSFWIDDDDGKEKPSWYDKAIEDTLPDWYRKEARLHYADGRIETIAFGAALAERNKGREEE